MTPTWLPDLLICAAVLACYVGVAWWLGKVDAPIEREDQL